MTSSPNYYLAQNGDKIAYHFSEGDGPIVVFLGGFMSDMQGSKALALEAFCCKQNYAFLRFDYHGHGQSSGDFQDGTIGRWVQNSLELIENALPSGAPLLLIGSSMGGWIMLHVAQRLSNRIAGLIGIAAAPDFTEDLIWNVFSDEQRAEMEKNNVVMLPSCYEDGSPYPITKALIEDGKAQCLLTADAPPIATKAPLRLIHGMKDADVPWQTSLHIAEKMDGNDVQIQLIQSGDHRLSSPEELDNLCQTLESLRKKAL